MSANHFDIYTSPDGLSEIEVHFDGDTCWLSLTQLAELFQRDKSVISRHLRNIYQQNEVDPTATVARNATVQLESGRRVLRTVRYYNLDVILSIGYRVNSKQGTRFRQWATRRLREALLDQLERTRQQVETKDHELRVLHDGISILHNAIHSARVTLPNLAWLRAFDSSLQLIGDYDHGCLDEVGVSSSVAHYPDLDDYYDVVSHLKSTSSSAVFGVEVTIGFRSALSQIQASSRDGDYYPSIEEKAAMLLYLIVKNHAFVDGNKRIAAACFLLFLRVNERLQNDHGRSVLSNDGLAGLTLFVASSGANQMETVKRVIMSVLNRGLNRP